MCGDNDGNDISETLSSVIEEDVVSTNKYSLANFGRCDGVAYNPLSIPSASYYTDDGSFVEEDSDDDDESTSSSELGGDERYTALEGALFG